MVHVEELAYQLIDRMFCLDFDVDGKEECQKEQNTTGDGDQLRNRQFTSMIIGSSVGNSVLKEEINMGLSVHNRFSNGFNLFEANDCHRSTSNHEAHVHKEEKVKKLVTQRTLRESPMRNHKLFVAQILILAQFTTWWTTSTT